MKKNIFIALIFCQFFLTANIFAAIENENGNVLHKENSAHKTGKSLVIKTQNGEIFDLSQQRGKSVVVLFWVSWCDICREELVDMNEVYKKINSSSKKLEIIAVNVDAQDDSADAKHVMNNINPTYKTAKLSHAIYNTFPTPRGFPATYFFNEKGESVNQLEMTR